MRFRQDGAHRRAPPYAVYVMMDAHNHACGSRPRQLLVVVSRLLQLLLLVSRAAPANAASPLDGCHHVFLDVGANIGIHSRFLFEPDKFPRSSFKEVFDRYFGTDRDAATTCAVAFEPNTMHRAHHAKQRAVYARKGWRYVHIEAAVGAKAGEMTFYANTRRESRFKKGRVEPIGLGFGVNRLG